MTSNRSLEIPVDDRDEGSVSDHSTLENHSTLDNPQAVQSDGPVVDDTSVDDDALSTVEVPVPWSARRFLVRALAVLTVALGANYIVWRWLFSVNWAAWPLAVPLILAETYSFVDGFLFGFTMWRLRERGKAPKPPRGATVDVFITTYNEDVEMVMTTALAAQAIRHPHETWVLDDGARPEMRAAAEAAGIGYLTRTEDWKDRPRHAKAGNLNNALFMTSGEFLLILDADQIPSPDILDLTLGWFRDDQVALVQTPQWFTNVTDSDPLGSQAPLFYGPIQQGKDGWNAAFFCGSNAVLRREALMQIGVAGYVREVERAVRETLRAADRILRTVHKNADEHGPEVREALQELRLAVRAARAELAGGDAVGQVTWRFQQRARVASRLTVSADLAALTADLEAIGGMAVHTEPESGLPVIDERALAALTARGSSPLEALAQVHEIVLAIDVDRALEAQAVMPMATISVTEDMATAMRLHAAGWRTVYHHEVLAHGLAPEDLATMLHQRLRWSQGTLQVLLRENPLTQRGLTVPQRMMYLATMWSYLSGFAAVVYIAAPIVYMLIGTSPVISFGGPFFLHLLPFLLANQLLFLVVGWGVKTWRGQQYSLALFPLWIRACTTAVGNVVFGRSLGFVVTPKTRQVGAPAWHLVRPQLAAMGLLVFAAVVGVVRMVVGQADILPTSVNMVWIAYDLVVLSVIVQAALYRGFEPETADAVEAGR
ncbi:MAG: glycosyltransferase [Friedmanniella sp.]|nr:glycosyltransferase [Friedmanniella sp.]